MASSQVKQLIPLRYHGRWSRRERRTGLPLGQWVPILENRPSSGAVGTDLAKSRQAGRPQAESQELSVSSFSLSFLGIPSVWSGACRTGQSRDLPKTSTCHGVPSPVPSSLGLLHSGPQLSYLPQTKSPAGTSSFWGSVVCCPKPPGGLACHPPAPHTQRAYPLQITAPLAGLALC